MSFSMSCSCSEIVWVEMTTRFLFFDGALDRGEQVGEGLADAGAGFDQQVVPRASAS